MSLELETLMQRALQARRDNRSPDAKRDWTEALELCRRQASPADLAKILTGLGQIERDLHNNDAALAHYEQAIAIYRSANRPLNLAHAIRHVADIHRHQRRYDLAAAEYGEALTIYRGDPKTLQLDLANTLRGFAILKEATGENAQARAFWQEAKELYAAVNVDAGVLESTRRLLTLGA
ncbi:MAG: tetratricopeptide repeat protein [Candidatus Sulfotelmatobacter sp.]